MTQKAKRASRVLSMVWTESGLHPCNFYFLYVITRASATPSLLRGSDEETASLTCEAWTQGIRKRSTKVCIVNSYTRTPSIQT